MAKTPTLAMVAVAELHPDPHNPRHDETPDEEMVQSVKDQGVLQSLLIRPDPVGGYMIIAGHRRWRSAVAARVSRVPAIIRDDWSEDDVLAVQVMENLHRKALNPIEQAEAMKVLRDSLGGQAAVARALGIAQPTVSTYLKLLELPKSVREKVASGEMGVARALGRVNAHGQIKMAAESSDPEFASIREAIHILGRAIGRSDPDAQSVAAGEAIRLLQKYVTGGGESGAPGTRCDYCRATVEVEAPFDRVARNMALSRHRAKSNGCRARYNRDLQQVG